MLTPHGVESHEWTIEGHWDPGPHSYEASVPHRIADRAVELDAPLAELCREAALRVALLDRSAAATVPGVAIALTRAEAAASCLLNDVIAVPRHVAAADADLPSTSAARAVARTAKNLEAHVEASRRAVTLGGIALAHRPPRRMASGRLAAAPYRATQTWRGGSDLWPRGADYVPPVPQHVNELMDDVAAFAARTDLDPIAQAALAHAQVRSIEPFPDGNDRVARALLHGVWRARGTTTSLVVPVSAALAAHPAQYDAAWAAFRRGDGAPVIELVARAAIRAADAAQDLARRIEALPDTWRTAARPRRGSAAHALTGLLTVHPVVDAARVRELTGAPQASAYDAIARLAEAGVLTRVSPTRRDTAWAALDVYEEVAGFVDDLAGRASRRDAGKGGGRRRGQGAGTGGGKGGAATRAGAARRRSSVQRASNPRRPGVRRAGA